LCTNYKQKRELIVFKCLTCTVCTVFKDRTRESFVVNMICEPICSYVYFRINMNITRKDNNNLVSKTTNVFFIIMNLNTPRRTVCTHKTLSSEFYRQHCSLYASYEFKRSNRDFVRRIWNLNQQQQKCFRISHAINRLLLLYLSFRSAADIFFYTHTHYWLTFITVGRITPFSHRNNNKRTFALIGSEWQYFIDFFSLSRLVVTLLF